MSFHNDRSEENPFLFGVTMEMPFLRKVGYALARAGSEVLSTKTERPGAEERYEAISSTDRAPALVIDGVDWAVAQSPGAMEGV